MKCFGAAGARQRQASQTGSQVGSHPPDHLQNRQLPQLELAFFMKLGEVTRSISPRRHQNPPCKERQSGVLLRSSLYCITVPSLLGSPRLSLKLIVHRFSNMSTAADRICQCVGTYSTVFSPQSLHKLAGRAARRRCPAPTSPCDSKCEGPNGLGGRVSGFACPGLNQTYSSFNSETAAKDLQQRQNCVHRPSYHSPSDQVATISPTDTKIFDLFLER